MGFLNINQKRKDQIIGFIAGIVVNVIGVIAYVLIFSKFSIATTLQDAYYKRYLGKLILLGALLDLAIFFFFINRYENERARGVLIASCVLAFIILKIKYNENQRICSFLIPYLLGILILCHCTWFVYLYESRTDG